LGTILNDENDGIAVPTQNCVFDFGRVVEAVRLRCGERSVWHVSQTLEYRPNSSTYVDEHNQTEVRMRALAPHQTVGTWAGFVDTLALSALAPLAIHQLSQPQ
jgi:hypothetical protein